MTAKAAQERIFQPSYGFDWQIFQAHLSQCGGYPEPFEEPQHQRLYLDSHDWGLFHAGLLLEFIDTAHQQRLLLRHLQGHQLIGECTLSKAPEFLHDIDSNSLRRRLEKPLGLRRLLPMARLQVEAEGMRIRDEESKQIGMVRWERWHERGSEHDCQLLYAVPMRGFEVEFGRIIDGVTQADALEPIPETLLHLATRTGERTPGDYNAKPSVRLVPAMTTAEAVRAILRANLKVMADNEAGICADLDTEYLHDYRIAVRKSRSVLSLVKGVFPEAELQRFREDLGELQRLTGPTRDMDVYFINLGGYTAQMPATINDDLEPVYEQIRLRRQRAFKRLKKGLQSKWYGHFKQAWGAFLESTEHGATTQGQRSVLSVADEILAKRYQRALKHGLAIHDETPAEALHDLRKDCKKYRYVIEFFGSLYPTKQIKDLLAHLKGLQDYLGHFQDLYTHYETLQEISAEMTEQGSMPPETLMAIGRLLEQMAVQQRQTREGFYRAFTPFAEAEQQALVKRLFPKRRDA